MSGVIKGGGEAAILAVRPAAGLPAVPREEAVRLQARIDQLEGQLLARSTDLLEADKSAETRAREAYQDGHAAGLAEGQAGEKERLDRLDQALAESLGELRAFFGQADRLALLFAHEALTRMFSQVDAMAPMVEQLLRRQIDELDKSAIVSVRVSAQDFGAAALGDLENRLNGVIPKLVRDESMPSGHCSIQLTLGEVEIGLPQQWSALSALLGQLLGAPAS